jgi:uncharacterized protein (TIGR00255 family)
MIQVRKYEQGTRNEKLETESMSIRSMTAFAQVRTEARTAPDDPGTVLAPGFSLSLKSVNHRYLDLGMRMPGDTDALEIKLRRLLKEKLARGHVDVTLSIERGSTAGLVLNREMVGGFLTLFRDAAREFGISSEPDLNALLRMPGALGGSSATLDGDFEASVLAAAEKAIAALDAMRLEEGRSIDKELRERMARLKVATGEVEKLRDTIAKWHLEKLQARLKEIMGAQGESDRMLQEVAMLAERSDVQEEIVRMHTHIQHFLGLLDQPGEVGKKLDFLLQEMNREANTLLSKTAGVAGEGLRITELGLAMKSEIEKSREQVQNVE